MNRRISVKTVKKTLTVAAANQNLLARLTFVIQAGVFIHCML
jgi:hypothetical protein